MRDHSFFFSSVGHENSESELIETLRAFSSPFSTAGNLDHHSICQFPARFKFLRKHIFNEDWNKFDFTKCQKYQKWRDNGDITSISLYFATGYFGNPASFFGHPLIKFNAGNGNSQLIDGSLNYGALTPNFENPVVYVFKGLLGGYPASFTRQNFFFHNHNYLENENRDLWEYKLNLEPEEVEYIVDFTFELVGRHHPYYFLSDNCAYRMAELLEQVFNQRLIFRNHLYVIPIDLFTNLASKKREDGRPLVSSISRVPSRYSRLSGLYLSLSHSDRLRVKQLIENSGSINVGAFENTTDAQKTKIFDTAINYYSFLMLKNPENFEIKRIRTHLIQERFKLPTSSNDSDIDLVASIPPHLSQHSFNLQMASVSSYQGSEFQEVGIRPALYDELNPSISRPKHTSLVVFDTRFRIKNEKITLRNLDIFRVSMLSPPMTDLPGDRNLAWRTQLGFRSQSLLCDNCLVGHFSGGVGLAEGIVEEVSLYGLGKGAIQSSKNNQGTVSLGGEVGMFLEPVSWWKIFMSYELEVFQNGLKSKRDIYKLEQRFGNSQNWDFCLEFTKADDTQVRSVINLYL